MKRSILTVALITALLGLNLGTHASTLKRIEIKKENSVPSKISELEIHGNVEILLSLGQEEKISLEENEFTNGAYIQKENQVLKISSYSPKKQVVWVTLTTLNKVSLYDHSSINTLGRISVLDFSLNLYDHSKANLNMDAFNASFSIKDQARANLRGYGEIVSFSHDYFAQIRNEDFTAGELTDNSNQKLNSQIQKMEFTPKKTRFMAIHSAQDFNYFRD